MSSILNDVKHNLGLLPDQPEFDIDIVMHINTVFAELVQIGAGPVTGFEITGPDETWDDFSSDPALNPIKSYVYLSVKLLFDPPQAGPVIGALERQKDELVFRINVTADYGA